MADLPRCDLREGKICTCIPPIKCEEVIEKTPNVCFGIRSAFEYGKRIERQKTEELLEIQAKRIEQKLNELIDSL